MAAPRNRAPLLDISLPAQLQVHLPKPQHGGIFLCNHRRETPSPRYRITLEANLVSLVLAGRKQLFGAEQAELFGAGSCLLFRKGRCLSADLCPDAQGYHSVLIFFDDAQVTSFKQRHRDLLFGSTADASSQSCLPFASSDFTQQFAEGLSRGLNSSSGFTVRQQALLCEQILLHLVERGGRRVVDFLDASVEESGTGRMERVLRQHALSNLTLEELAFLCGMSPATFKRHFAQRYGMSPGRWQKARLLEHAARLLREEKLPPGDVYWRVGYPSPSSFTKAFREHHRSTPGAYQNGGVGGEPNATVDWAERDTER